MGAGRGDHIRRGRVLLDGREGCLAYARDILEAIRERAIRAEGLYGEPGEVLIGRRPGRAKAQEIRLSDSLGVAIQDLVTARHVFREAERRGIGTTAEL